MFTFTKQIINLKLIYTWYISIVQKYYNISFISFTKQCKGTHFYVACNKFSALKFLQLTPFVRNAICNEDKQSNYLVCPTGYSMVRHIKIRKTINNAVDNDTTIFLFSVEQDERQYEGQAVYRQDKQSFFTRKGKYSLVARGRNYCDWIGLLQITKLTKKFDKILKINFTL